MRPGPPHFAQLAVDIAERVLKPAGCALIKLFQGAQLPGSRRPDATQVRQGKAL
jgi:hypothetical protein